VRGNLRWFTAHANNVLGGKCRGAGLLAFVVACGGDARDSDPFGSAGLSSAGGDTGGDGDDDDDDDSEDGGAQDGDDGMGPKLDLGEPGGGDDDDDAPQICHVVDDASGVAPCSDTAPPDSFEPEVQWAWEGVDGFDQSVTTPLVANLTDDNGDGVVDLCDIPDIVVNVYKETAESGGESIGRVAILDGETGSLHHIFDTPVISIETPALADIDGDGVVEIVAVEVDDTVPFIDNPPARIVAFHADGSTAMAGPWNMAGHSLTLGAIAIADLEGDGDGEIMVDGKVFDHLGNLVWSATDHGGGVASAADLDGDGDLEVISGPRAYHHDGSVYFDALPGEAGLSAVADLDADGQPEVLTVMWPQGIAIIEHDGSMTHSGVLPTVGQRRPPAIHDIDGDDVVELLIASDEGFSAVRTDLTVMWTAANDDTSGMSGATAFDFLGDGSAEAIYADETQVHVYGPGGATLMTSPRASWTSIEYPVVADVDNDGSAEIVITSNYGYWGNPSPPVQVVRDVQDRWIPARRIWNQHTYHVTNIREDGTLPSPEPPHWQGLNTFRTQAQIANGGVCDPTPEG